MKLHVHDSRVIIPLFLLLAAAAGCGSKQVLPGATSFTATVPRPAAPTAAASGPARSVSVADAFEPDNSAAAALAISPDSTIQDQDRSITPAGDQDWVSFTGTVSTTYYFWATGTGNTRADVLDSGQNVLLASHDEGQGNNFLLAFTPASTATYYVRMQGETGSTLAAYHFKFTISTVAGGDSYEEDDDFPSAQPIKPCTVEIVQTHTFEGGSDPDLFSFTGDVGNTYTFSSEGGFDDGSAAADPQIDIFPGTFFPPVGGDDDSGPGVDFLLLFIANQDDTYYADVSPTGVAIGQPFAIHILADFDPRPTNVTASAGTFTDHVHVAWTAPDAAMVITSYDVLRSDNGGPFNVIGSTASTSFNDFQNFDSVTGASYAVQEHSTTGISTLSLHAGGFPSISAPTNVAATDGTFTDKVRVSWTAANPVPGYYQVLRAPAPSGPYSSIGTTTSTIFFDSHQSAADFWYKVRSANGGVGYSAFSPGESGHTGLGAPTNVSATDGAFTDKVRVSWTAASPAPGYYQVLRATAQTGPYAAIGTTTGTQFDDTRQTTAVFWYEVRSVQGGVGYSAYSDPNAGHAGMAAPTNVSATDGTLTDRVRVSWTAATPAPGYYQVLRATSQTGSFAAIGTTTSTHYDDVLQSGATFWYEVRSANGGVGYSAPSNVDDGHAGLAAPTGVAASDGTFTDHVHVDWIDVAGADYYQVFRATSLTGTYTLVGSPASTAFDDHPSTTAVFFYKVRAAISGVGYSSLSNADPGNRS